MQFATAGEAIRVPKAKTFVIERRSLAGSGGKTEIQIPEGVVHLGTREPNPSDSFGGRPKICEKFQCLHEGDYEIRFISGRPWETSRKTVTTKVICR
jgi:hypothetical protein